MTTLRIILISLLLICFPLISFSESEDVSLDAFLKYAIGHSEDLHAIELDIQALEKEIEARDLELSPTLSAALNKFWDHRPSLSSNFQTTGENIELNLEKPFATGTSLNLLSGIETSEYESPSDGENLLNWQLGISQSLWQNRFGRQTSFRRERDQAELRNRLLEFLQERQDLLIELELLYWDIAYTAQEYKIREQNLERSQRIFEWMEERFNRSAAERVDLLQTQALVSTRQLELQLTSDHLKTFYANLNKKLLIAEGFTPLEEELKKDRELASLSEQADFAPSTPVLIETLRTQAEAKQLEEEAKFEIDKLKPTLEFGYSYGQQGLNESFSTARRQAFFSSHDYHQVGIVFSVPLDFYLANQSARSFKLKAQAEKIRSIRAARESNVQWDDLKRAISEQKQRLETAIALAKIHQEKSQEERERYKKGRTTAFQAITFEQEAAESELLVLELTAQLRRTETQARNYIYHPDHKNEFD
ncbi:MAG: TolC family protein [Candidatus Omnitrophica bacterium]|nr:TolC family protein [Candidatus Omnitrophota bacterium]